MKKGTLTVLTLLVCAGLVACSTVATLGTDANTALKELTAVHQTRDQLLASKDVAGLSKQHASNLSVTLADGTKLDRAGYEALLQKSAGAAGPTRITELTQEETGYVATVTPGLDGQGSVLRETWTRTGEGWKLKKIEAMSEQAAVAARNE
jgi:hypothetical protein